MAEVIWSSKCVNTQPFFLWKKKKELIKLMTPYSARISAVKSREIGWEPRMAITDFYNSFDLEVEEIVKSGPKH